MSQISELIRLFYDELWNRKNLEISDQILHEQVNFRGSLGHDMVGSAKVRDYVVSVTNSLANYKCEIQELIAEKEKAAVKVWFSGMHVQDFMGYKPTGKLVQWQGTAFFESKDGSLTKIWVLGDLQGLEAILAKNSRS